MKKLLVTGATGFLGRHVIEAILEKPAAEFGEGGVRLLCRRNHPWEGNARIETLTGNILDREAVRHAVEGVDVVLHLAGRVTRDPQASASLFETHIEGTRNVCDAALEHGKPKVILASSSGTIGVSCQPVVHDETAPYAVDVARHWPYYLSKIYQEKLAFSYFEKYDLPVVVMNPSLLLGPGDIYMSSTNDIQMYLDRQLGNIPSGGLNFVDVRDAAHTFMAAIESGKPGRRYLIGGHNMTVREFFYVIQFVSSVRAPLLSLPEIWCRRTANVLRRGADLLGRRFPLNDITIEMAYRFWYCDNTRARKELDLDPRPAERTIRDTVAFLQTCRTAAS